MNNTVIMMLDEMPTPPKAVQCINESTRELLVFLAFIGRHETIESVLKKSMKGNVSDSTATATSEAYGTRSGGTRNTGRI